MSGGLGLGAILFGAAILVARFAERPIGGLPPEEFAALTAFGGIALVMTSWIVNEFRYRGTEGLRALAIWGATFALLIAAYIHKDELETVLDRMIGEVSPGRTVVTPNGEVVVARRAGGGFTLRGRINDHDARFIFDTGASAVVLTSESAAAAGLHPDKLIFSVPVSTANGRTLAAPVVLDTVTIGPIVERRVEALVARPGVLHENLLGMTFLERLGSYEVRGNRLILRAVARGSDVNRRSTAAKPNPRPML